VTVCDGVGTVITDKEKIVQGIGAEMSGLLETSSLPEVMKRLKEENAIVLDRKNAEMNQFKGVKKAIENGYRKIGVTIMDPKDAENISRDTGSKRSTTTRSSDVK